MTYLEQFKIRFPEFSTQDDAKVQLFIDDAVLLLNKNVWGKRYDLGIMYYAAHSLAMNLKTAKYNGDFLGSVSSKNADGVGISYTMPSLNKGDSDDYYRNTAYGMQFYKLRELVAQHIWVV